MEKNGSSRSSKSFVTPSARKINIICNEQAESSYDVIRCTSLSRGGTVAVFIKNVYSMQDISLNMKYNETKKKLRTVRLTIAYTFGHYSI